MVRELVVGEDSGVGYFFGVFRKPLGDFLDDHSVFVRDAAVVLEATVREAGPFRFGDFVDGFDEGFVFGVGYEVGDVVRGAGELKKSDRLIRIIFKR